MPLTIDKAVEPPEVAALKKKVITVADKYTKRHGWCDEVRAALREAGILDTATIRVDVEFQIGNAEHEHATQRFDIADLIGKTDEEQKEYVAAKIASGLSVMVAGKSMKVPFKVIDLTEVKPPKQGESWVAYNGLSIPGGYHAALAGEAGRVTHLWEATGVIEQMDQEEFIIWCQNQSYHRPKPVCHFDMMYTRPFRSTSGDEKRVCLKCADILRRRGINL